MMSLVERALAKLGIEATVRGRKALALCPFHDDRRVGNFMVYASGDRAGGFRCFSCGAHGGLRDLVARRRGCSIEGALEWIDRLREQGDEQGDEGPVVERVQLTVASVHHRTFQLPKEIKFGPLDGWVLPAREYARKRHLTERQIEGWGIGYATVGRLSGRIVLPVCDARGVARSYMARTFAGHEARYYYPRDRELPDLDCMFGEQWWPPVAARRRWQVVVAEGALNALAVERAMGTAPLSVAALGGSDPRPMHVAKLAGFGHVVVMTDDDRAGRGAAWELSVGLARHTRVTRVSLGEGRDADDVPPEELRSRLCEATSTG